MEYIRVSVKTGNEETSELVIALLTGLGYQGFEEAATGVLAYIGQPDFEEAALSDTLNPHGLSFETSVIPDQNWNAVWESNFEPIVLPGFCRIRADFHEPDAQIPLELLINPKMSFGTGHHATTQLVMLTMRNLEFTGKKVIDFGTGTGVLAILAEKLGASDILALDNDPWSVANALENAAANGCRNIEIREGALEEAGEVKTDVMLANINRHILLQYMARMAALLVAGGDLVVSGILSEDVAIISKEAALNGLEMVQERKQDNWVSIHFRRK